MKINQVLLSLLISVSSVGMVGSSTSESIDGVLSWEQLQEVERIERLRKEQFHQDELNRFLNDIGHRESGNRYDIVNPWGYMGRYQFGKSTLKGLGFDVTRKEFLNNPQIQEEAMMALLQHNQRKLQTYIELFDGKTVNGNTITESGILAAAHLGGAGAVKRYFKNGKVFKDAYGTKITSYMTQFSGYDIKLN